MNFRKRCIKDFLKSYGEDSVMKIKVANSFSLDKPLLIPLIESRFLEDEIGRLIEVEKFIKKVNLEAMQDWCFVYSYGKESFVKKVFIKEDLPDISELKFSDTILIGFQKHSFYLILGADVDFFVGTKKEFENIFNYDLAKYVREAIRVYYKDTTQNYDTSIITIAVKKIESLLSQGIE